MYVYLFETDYIKYWHRYSVRIGNDPRNRIILLDTHIGKSKANKKLDTITNKIEKFNLKKVCNNKKLYFVDLTLRDYDFLKRVI